MVDLFLNTIRLKHPERVLFADKSTSLQAFLLGAVKKSCSNFGCKKWRLHTFFVCPKLISLQKAVGFHGPWDVGKQPLVALVWVTWMGILQPWRFRTRPTGTVTNLEKWKMIDSKSAKMWGRWCYFLSWEGAITVRILLTVYYELWFQAITTQQGHPQ